MKPFIGYCIKAHKFDNLFNLGQFLNQMFCIQLTRWSRLLIAVIFLRMPLADVDSDQASCTRKVAAFICQTKCGQSIAFVDHLLSQSRRHLLSMYFWSNQKSFDCPRLGDCIQAHKFETLFNLSQVPVHHNICIQLAHWSRHLIAATSLRTPLADVDSDQALY